MMPQSSTNPSSPTKKGFVSSIRSVFRRKSIDTSNQGKKTRELLNKLGHSHSFHEELAQSMPSNNVVRDDVQQMMATMSAYQKEYEDLLETCEELVGERIQTESVITKSTRLESLDDLDLAEQYFKSLTDSQEISKVEVAKLTALNKELTERDQNEELQRLQVLLNVKENASVILTRINPLSVGPDAINVGGGLYRVKKPTDMKEQSVDVSSDDNKLGSLRSINVKLAEQLKQKNQELEELERRNMTEKENLADAKVEMEAQIQCLRDEMAEYENKIKALEAQNASMKNQESFTKEALEKHQILYEEAQKRIQFLEQELGLRSRLEGNVKEGNTSEFNNHIDVTKHEQIISAKEEEIKFLQAEIVELKAKQSVLEKESEGLQQRLKEFQEMTTINVKKVEMERVECQMEELSLQQNTSSQSCGDAEELRSQLEDAQTTIIAFKAEINRLKEQLDRTQSTGIEYLRTVFLRFLQKPECRQQSLELMKTLLQFTPEEQATFQLSYY